MDGQDQKKNHACRLQSETAPDCHKWNGLRDTGALESFRCLTGERVQCDWPGLEEAFTAGVMQCWPHARGPGNLLLFLGKTPTTRLLVGVKEYFRAFDGCQRWDGGAGKGAGCCTDDSRFREGDEAIPIVDRPWELPVPAKILAFPVSVPNN